MSIKSVIRHGVMHAKYTGVGVKVCSAFTFRATLMAHVFQWKGCLGMGCESLQIPSSVPFFAVGISGCEV